MENSNDAFDWRTVFDTQEYDAYELLSWEIFSNLHAKQDDWLDFNRFLDDCDDFEDSIDYKKLNCKLREILEQSEKRTCLDNIKAYLLPYNKEHRRRIVRRCGGQAPVIYKAVMSKYLDVIEYFLKECEVNVDVMMNCRRYESIEGLGSNFYVTPLVYACIHGDIEAVKLLVDNGAEFCCTNARISNPIHAAICKGHMEIVQYLMETTGKVDIKNSAMFLSSIPNEQMFQYLLSKGFDPNMKDSKGFTSLHRALHSDRYFYSNHKTVEMLLQAGADLNIKDSDGFDSVIVAAKERDRKSFYLLSLQANASQISVVNGYELVGALDMLEECVYPDRRDFDDDDIEVGSHELWSKALSLRCADPLKPILKPVTKPKEIFEFATEFQTFDELEALKDQDSLVQYYQVALILERVIGWNHPYTLRHLAESIALSFFEDVEYRRSFDILMYARNAHLDRDKFASESVLIMEAMILVIYRGCYSGVLFWKESVDLLNKIFKQTKDFAKEIEALQDELFTHDGIVDKNNFNKLSETNDDDSESESNHEMDDGNTESESSHGTDDDNTESESSHETDDNYTGSESCHETDDDGPIDQSHETYDSSVSENKNLRGRHSNLEDLITEYQENIRLFSNQSLCLFFYLLGINSLKFTKEIEELFRQYVAEDIRGDEEESVLHSLSYLLSHQEIHGNRNQEIHGNSLAKYNVRYEVVQAVFDYLLVFSADINSFDREWNTPLHYALRPIKEKQQSCKGMKMNATVEKLIKHGAHLDYFNDNGECTLDILRKMDHNIDEINISSLQCLAARAVVQYDWGLTANLPPFLRYICKLHWNRKT